MSAPVETRGCGCAWCAKHVPPKKPEKKKPDQVAAMERRIVKWLRRYADEAEKVPGPPQYEDALRDAADGIEKGRHR